MNWIALLHLCAAVLAAAAKAPPAAAAVLGVDLGTDFVKASLVAPNAPFELVLTPDSQRKDASGLVIKPDDGERVYGSAGLSLLSKFPGEALYATKQLLGLPFHDLRVGLFSELNPGLALVPTKRNSVAVNVTGEIVPVEEIAAMQLQEVVARAEHIVREKTRTKRAALKKVAISVPGHFGSAQRQALVDAAALADLELVTLVSDGTAVAINYANAPAVLAKLSADRQHTVVVYDVGAGSAEATLVGLSLSPTDDAVVNVEVLGSGAALELGGRALTAVMRELILARFADKHGEAERTPRLLNRLWREAERAKQVLSANGEVHVHIEALANDKDLSTKITRKQFEDAAAFQVDLVTQPLDQALAGRSPDDIDAVVLAGGATRTPFILERLAAVVGDAKLSKNVNGDEANVQGTAMRGINLSGVYRSKRKFNVSEASPVAYHAEIHTANGASRDTVELFPAGEIRGAMAELPLPRDLTKLVLFEGTKPLTTWEFPYLAKNVDSLYEPGSYTCVGKARLRAKFMLNENGVVSMRNVEALCDSVRAKESSTTSSAVVSATGSASGSDASASASDAAGDAASESTSESASETVDTTSSVAASETTSAGESETASETAGETATKDGKGSKAASSVYPKIRRVSALPKWEQAPVGVSEQAEIRAHLTALDKKDADRREFSGMSHELEVLAYRIRGLVKDGEAHLASAAEHLLEFVEYGAASAGELKEKLKHARDLLAAHTDGKSSADTNEAGSTEKASTEKASTDKASTEKSSTEKASTEKASTEKASTEKASTSSATTTSKPAATTSEAGHDEL